MIYWSRKGPIIEGRLYDESGARGPLVHRSYVCTPSLREAWLKALKGRLPDDFAKALARGETVKWRRTEDICDD